jgi:hypothetical protein
LLGSQAPTGLPRFHKPSQSGYFFASSAVATALDTSTAASAAAHEKLRNSIAESPSLWTGSVPAPFAANLIHFLPG